MTFTIRVRDAFILALLTAFLLLAFIGIYHQYTAEDGWTVADWLINYQQGFVRRGLPGTLITGLAMLSGLKPGLFVLFTQAILYFTFAALFFLLIKARQIPFWFWLLLLSPATLLFSIYDDGPVGKKELLYLCLLTVYVFSARGVSFRPIIAPWLWGGISLLATLSHELFFFYTPYFLWASIILKKENPTAIKTAIAILLSSLLTILVIYVHGQKIDGNITCQQLTGLGMSRNICNGILSYPFNDFNSALTNTLRVASEYHYYSYYLIAIVLSLFPLLFSRKLHNNGKNIYLTLALSLTFSIPLFVAAIDWGRWINIHAMSVLIVSTLFLPKAPSLPITHYQENEQKLARKLWHHSARKIAATLVISSYALSWSIPHCCEKHLSYGIFSLIKI